MTHKIRKHEVHSAFYPLHKGTSIREKSIQGEFKQHFYKISFSIIKTTASTELTLIERGQSSYHTCQFHSPKSENV